MATTPPVATLKPPLGERDHIQGSPEAPIEMVEYGDYECPHCGKAAAIVTQLQAEFGDKLRFAFRHFPLSKMHPHARKAAMAAEAAGTQGKFWQMHEMLFRGAPALDYASLLGYAKKLELDTARFELELSNDTYAERIQEDVAGGVRSGVNGTPTFFINGKRHNGAYAIESLRAGLEMAE
jgi:protein-disulfide isomerase